MCIDIVFNKAFVLFSLFQFYLHFYTLQALIAILSPTNVAYTRHGAILAAVVKLLIVNRICTTSHAIQARVRKRFTLWVRAATLSIPFTVKAFFVWVNYLSLRLNLLCARAFVATICVLIEGSTSVTHVSMNWLKVNFAVGVTSISLTS